MSSSPHTPPRGHALPAAFAPARACAWLLVTALLADLVIAWGSAGRIL
jgi:hypothetical protein